MSYDDFHGKISHKVFVQSTCITSYTIEFRLPLIVTWRWFIKLRQRKLLRGIGIEMFSVLYCDNICHRQITSTLGRAFKKKHSIDIFR